jgi:hypothetical protein
VNSANLSMEKLMKDCVDKLSHKIMPNWRKFLSNMEAKCLFLYLTSPIIDNLSLDAFSINLGIKIHLL